MNKNKEIQFLYNYIIRDKDFRNVYNQFKENLNISFEETIIDLLEYCFYSEFNPYLDKAYIDYWYLKNIRLNKIYNIDDIFMCYYDNLESY